MTSLTFKGQPTETVGSLPQIGATAPEFTLVRKDLSEAHLKDYGQKKKLLNIFVSLETSICSLSVKKFYEKIQKIDNAIVLNISKDLPFAQARFCTADSALELVEMLSAFRSSFARDYGLEIKTGPLTGLCSRAVIVLDAQNRILYVEQLPEIAKEPNYEAALEALRQ